MPQLDPAVFLPQIFWLAIVFGLIYLFISYSATPRITEVLERRQNRIASDLDEAGKLQAQATAARVSYEKSLEQARAAAASTIASKRDAIKADIDAQYNKLSEKLNSEAAIVDDKIRSAKDRALDDIRAMSADVCKEIIRSISGLALDEKVIAGVVNGKFDAVKDKING